MPHIKAAHFSAYRPGELETGINLWIENEHKTPSINSCFRIESISYSTAAMQDNDICYSALIFYYPAG